MEDPGPREGGQHSAHEYARLQRLAVDYLTNDPLAIINAEIIPIKLKDPPDSAIFPCNPIPCLLPERLSIDRDAVLLLSHVYSAPSWTSIPDPFRARKLKVELPLLRTDNDLDLADFTRRADIPLKDEALPLDKGDEEHEEGFTWPSATSELLSTYWARASSEKLTVSKDTVAFLQKAITPCDKNEIFPKYSFSNDWGDQFPGEIVSSPLLPMSPETETVDLSFGMEDLGPISGHNSPLQIGLQELNGELLNESPIRSASAPAKCCFPLAGCGAPSFEPIQDMCSQQCEPEPRQAVTPRYRSRSEDLRVVSPLTPPLSTVPMMRSQHMCFNAALQETNSQLEIPMSRQHDNLSSQAEQVSASELEKHTAKVNQMLQNETIQESSIQKIFVPDLDFTKSLVPGKSQKEASRPEIDSRASVLPAESQDLLRPDALLPQLTSVERLLSWDACSEKSIYATIDENNLGNDTSEAWIAPSQGVESTVFSPDQQEGGALGTTGEDNEGIETAGMCERPNLGLLIKKRKREIEKYKDQNTRSGRSSERKEARITTIFHESEDEERMIPTFSAFTSLESFLSIRTGKSRMIDGFRKNLSLENGPSTTLVLPEILENPAPMIRVAKRIAHNPLAVPEVDSLCVPGQYVVSSVLMNHRRLIRLIRSYHPECNLVERDFSVHTPLRASTVEAQSRPPDFLWDSINHEADLIVDSETGVLVTTLQRLHQRALPGKDDPTSPLNALYMRAAVTAQRYATLVVIISQNAPPEALPMPITESDRQAIASLVGFGKDAIFAGQDTTLKVYYSPGGEQELAVSLVNLMIGVGRSRHTEEPFSRLWHEESKPEVWLRKMGVNAYAAQVILSHMSVQLGEDVRAKERTRRQFVEMVWEDRVNIFENAFSGKALLARVSRSVQASYNLLEIQL